MNRFATYIDNGCSLGNHTLNLSQRILYSVKIATI